jgi:hypothetical protein
VAPVLEVRAIRASAAHLDAETVAALRGMARRNQGLEQVVPSALAHVAGFPIRRMPLPPLLGRIAEAVAAAREAGVYWSAIGGMLGTSGEAARKRYGVSTKEPSVAVSVVSRAWRTPRPETARRRTAGRPT